MNGTVRHCSVLPEITESRNDFAVTLAPRYRLTSEIFGSRATDAGEQRDPGVNADWGCQLSGWRSDNSVAINSALAAEGARIAARIVRQQRLRDMLAAIAEFWRASGADRTYWRSQGALLIREWRHLYEAPERAAFNAAVTKSRRAA